MTRSTRLAPALAATLIVAFAPAFPSQAARTTPRDGCADITDASGDDDATLPYGGVKPEKDSDLDILGVSFQTTATHLKIFMRINDLVNKPKFGNGHRFEVGFDYQKKPYKFVGGQVDSQTQTIANTSPVPMPKYPFGEYNGSQNTEITPEVTYDATTNLVVFSVARAALTKVSGDPWADGGTTEKTKGETYLVWNPAGQSVRADTAEDAEAAKRTFTIGASKCFDPQPTDVDGFAAVRVAYGDTVKVGGGLLDWEGQPLAEREVTIAPPGAAPVTLTTDEEGNVETTVSSTSLAGNHTMKVTYAGDDDNAALDKSIPFTIVPETIRVSLAAARTSATARVVTVTVKEDDGRVLANHPVTWLVNGRKVGTGRTDSRGQARWNATSGQTVVADVPVVTGKYAAGKATLRV